MLPLIFGTSGLGLLVYGCVAELNPVAVGLAAASLLAVMARTMLTFRDNVAMLRASREEAQTDALTGLGNRRALARALERELPRATAAEPLVLVLFDLDGFKHYNDTFGHPAGDALLVRLGGSLAAFLHGRGVGVPDGRRRVLRAAAAAATGRAEPLVVGAAAALSEHGEGFEIGCSYGAIELPLEAANVADALRIADQRMYAQKNAGRDVREPPEQGRAAARAGRAQPGAAQPPRRRRRPRRGDRAAAAARPRRGRAGAPRRRAARRRQGRRARRDPRPSPGRSTEEEWAFIRRHTIIGERIIGAAPALTRVAAAGAPQPRALGRHAATRTRSPARRSRSARGSSPSRTRSTR